VIGLTKTWAKELGRKGITVNAVAPGFIKTSVALKVPEKVLEKMVEQVRSNVWAPLLILPGRTYYLASEDGDDVNGTVKKRAP